MLNVESTAKNPVAFKAPRNYQPPQTFNPNSGLPIGKDAYKKYEIDEHDKRMEKYMKYVGYGAMIAGAALVPIGLSKLMKLPYEKEAQKALTEQAKAATRQMSSVSGEIGIEPTQAQQELGYKTTAEIKKMYEDIGNASTFSELELQGELKDQFKLILDQIKRAKTYEEYCQELEKCTLFYGPPGTGKTVSVLALCKELGVNPFVYDIGKLKGGYSGAVEYNMNKASDVFLAEHRAAREKDPNHISILFFDECDELFRTPSGANGNYDSQLLQRFKRGFNQWKNEPGVFIFGNTNCMPEELESAMENRWKSVFIDLPTEEALAKAFFKHYKKGGSKVANDLKEEKYSPHAKKLFKIMHDHNFSYRDLQKNCWQGITVPENGKSISIKDLADNFIKRKNILNLTDEEVKILSEIAK